MSSRTRAPHMRIDLGNALDDVASPGISQEALERLDSRVARAHERIERRRRDAEHGYVALDLPTSTDIEAIKSALAELPDPTDVILVGIGGSALGAATIADALSSSVDLHVLDHIDPATVSNTLEDVPLQDAVVHIVSRSGTTTETLANALIVRDTMEHAGVDWTERTLVTTGESGPLRELADANDLPVLDPPVGVPGRYSVLSSMGLPAVGLLGHDLDALLAGGQTATASRAGSLFSSPAYAFGAISYGLAVRGVPINAMMPYAEGLETFAEWFAQLWAESLGKDGLGQVPVRALGVTDQHSQLQLYRSGPRLVQVSFLTVESAPTTCAVPSGPIADEAGISGVDLAAIARAEFEGTEASLAAAGRPSVRIELPSLDEHALGELLVSMQASCMLAAELFGVNAFDQPAVEWGKRATRALLSGTETTETQAISEKRTLTVQRE